MSVKWGIVGVSKISNDFVVALRSNLTEKEHTILAVASKDKKRATEFAEKFQIAQFHGSYEELAQNEEVEIVYIGVLNPYHFEVCKLMLEHGKHILCEKPLCMNTAQTTEILNLAEKKSLFAMEGVCCRLFPVYTYLRKMIDNGELGEIKEVHVKHGYKGYCIPRVIDKQLGGGILLDIGVNAVQFALFCFKGVDVEKIQATGKLNENGADLFFEVELKLSNGGFAKIICSAYEDFKNEAFVVGSKGTVCIPNYWCPISLIQPDSNVRTWWLVESEEPRNYTNSLGLRYEADAAAECLRSGKLFSDAIPPAETLRIAQIADEIRRQIGVTYDCDML